MTDNQLVFNFQFMPPPPPPANDNFSAATEISTMTFSESVDVSAATTETGEPLSNCFYSVQDTVWYKFIAPGNGSVYASLSGTWWGETPLNVYRADGEGFGGLSPSLGCSTQGGFNVSVEAGKTYYFQAGTFGWVSGYLYFSMSFMLAPANDNFADAKLIESLPFDDSTDMTAASTEVDEPMPSCGSASKTIWYAYTPTASGSLSQRTETWSYSVVGVYTGNSLGALQEVACRSRYWYDSSFLTFHVDAGTTYYFQLGTYENAWVPFHLEVAPPPVAEFGYGPYDPSIFDTIGFYGGTYDPAGVGIQSWDWNFGDGTTATGQYVNHRYAADGDYTVQLTVTTPDGRTASTTRTVQVRTHDVTIAKFTVPQSAKSGQTRHLAVGISNKRYPEEVDVQLYKSYPGYGWQWVGTLHQSVPVRSGNRTTEFSFNYTFTAEDALMGKVTFRAVAVITNARDALPADNEVIALPTKVTKK
jgi:PKD repeat protein